MIHQPHSRNFSVKTRLTLFYCLLLTFSSLDIRAEETSAWKRDPGKLDLASVNALVIDTKTNQILYSRNPDAVVPIASVSKLMTAMVILDANQPMDEIIKVNISQTKELKNVYSRVRLNSELPRKEMLLLTLMSSENRAASTLAHHYPGGYAKFMTAMNAKARALGLNHTHFVEPTGLSYSNVSTPRDLAKMIQAAARYPMIKQLSTTPNKDAHFHKPNYALSFYNTNPLVRQNKWDIHLSKTGFNNKAGHCLVMLTDIQDRTVAIVLLDSFGKRTHAGDAVRVKSWLETGRGGAVPAAAKSYVMRKTRNT